MTVNVESAFVDIVTSNSLTSANCIEYFYQLAVQHSSATVFYYLFLNGRYSGIFVVVDSNFTEARKKEVDNMSMAGKIYL